MLQFNSGVFKMALVSNIGRRDGMVRKGALLHENMTKPKGISSKTGLSTYQNENKAIYMLMMP